MAAPVTGQVAVSGTAQALSATPVSAQAFTIKAPNTNTLPVYIGPAGVSSSTGHQLDPGDEITYERRSQTGGPIYQLGPADFYVVGTAPDKVTWLVSP